METSTTTTHGEEVRRVLDLLAAHGLTATVVDEFARARRRRTCVGQASIFDVAS